MILKLKLDNVNVHRAAAKVIVSKSRAARGSVCNVLLSDDWAGIASGKSLNFVLCHEVYAKNKR